MYDFDEVINRKNTDSLKYDYAVKRGKPEDILPFWVADMDFRTPDCVIKALQQKAAHGIYGYSDTLDDYSRILKNWYQKRFNWRIEEEWLIKTPGIVFAIALAISAYTEKGDGILIQQPVYYPFEATIRDKERKLVVNQLKLENNHYVIDFEDFENKIINENVKLFILCSPHNPVGRVWSQEELLQLGRICQRHRVLVISDEIHADFVRKGHKHHIFANLPEDFSDITITCTSPSKTFNLAGLQISNIFITNKVLRDKFYKELDRFGYSQPNLMGLVAAKAAYESGEAWLEALLDYLEENRQFLKSYIKENLPVLDVIDQDGTYLVWIDCHKLRLDDKSLEDILINDAKVWLDSGHIFGQGGSGFQRINIACPRSVLEEGLSRIVNTLKNYL